MHKRSKTTYSHIIVIVAFHLGNVKHEELKAKPAQFNFNSVVYVEETNLIYF